VFEARRDPAVFATARQHPLRRTAAWANGADFAPEIRLDLLRAQQGDRAAQSDKTSLAAPGPRLLPEGENREPLLAWRGTLRGRLRPHCG